MILPELTFGDFLPLLPALVLSVGAILLCLSEAFLSTPNRAYQSVLALITSAVAGMLALSSAFEPARPVFMGLAVHDAFSAFLSVIVCLGAGLSTLLAAGFLQHRNAERGEFYGLLLFAAAGMSLLAISAELITLFVNLEVLSVATYALTAYLRRGPRPTEAAFKYFILGAFSAAVLLYGAALLYGATGTTKIYEMQGRLSSALETSPGLVYLGLLFLAAGFAFKIAAVPFHMWTPDVYEGAPTPVTALMSAGVKAAAFGAMVRVFLFLGRGADTQVILLFFSTLAVLTMVGGNLLALPQRNVKRMLAYSSIAHAGYILLAVAVLFVRPGVAGDGSLLGPMALLGAGGPPVPVGDAFKGILFYLLAYTVSAIGAFGLLAAIERREDDDRGIAWDLDRLSGLAQRRPAWAAAMAIFMLSLAGIPPTVGFMSKLLIFRAAVDAGLVGLVVVAALASAAGTYYYLRVVVYMFMRPAPEGQPALERSWPMEFALALSAAAVVLLGVAPGTITGWLSQPGLLFGAP